MIIMATLSELERQGVYRDEKTGEINWYVACDCHIHKVLYNIKVNHWNMLDDQEYLSCNRSITKTVS